jgi:hypothetical protein
MKIILIILGLVSLCFGLFLALAITVYSLKEQDDTGFYFLVIPVCLIVTGIYLISKALKAKTVADTKAVF